MPPGRSVERVINSNRPVASKLIPLCFRQNPLEKRDFTIKNVYFQGGSRLVASNPDLLVNGSNDFTALRVNKTTSANRFLQCSKPEAVN